MANINLFDYINKGLSIHSNLLKQKTYYFDNIASMKVAKLKAGDFVITKGYYEANDGGNGEYEIVDESSLVDDGGSVHDLSNGLKAKLIIKNGEVNVKQFGAKGDGVNDSTIAIQNSINYINSKISSSDSNNLDNGIIIIPTGIYCVKNILLKSRITLKGNGMYKTIIKPLLNDGSVMFYQSSVDWNNGKIMTNLSLEDFSISPNGSFWGNSDKANISVFDLSTNVNLYIKNVGFDNILGTCLDLRTCMDSYISNVWITYCGNNNDYAIKLGTKNADTSNAITFDMIHIEQTEKMLELDGASRQNKFINCKFEDGSAFNYTNPRILLNSSLSNVFTNCIFIAHGDNPMIVSNGGSACDSFANCSFAVGSKGKGNFIKTNGTPCLNINSCVIGEFGVNKFITNGSNININNCTFFNSGTDGILLDLITNCNLNNNIFSNPNSDTYLIQTKNKNNIEDNIFINCKNNQTLINVCGYDNIISRNRYYKSDGNNQKFINIEESCSGNIFDKNYIAETDFSFNGDTRKYNMFNQSYSTTIGKISNDTEGSLRYVNGFMQIFDNDTTYVNIPKQLETADWSTATTTEDLKNDFNNLLTKLVNSKVLK